KNTARRMDALPCARPPSKRMFHSELPSSTFTYNGFSGSVQRWPTIRLDSHSGAPGRCAQSASVVHSMLVPAQRLGGMIGAHERLLHSAFERQSSPASLPEPRMSTSKVNWSSTSSHS